MASGKYGRDDKMGMARFSTWFGHVDPKPPRGITPTDIDAVIHDGVAERFIVIEFKPPDVDIQTGQRLLLEGFSKLPGCQALLVEDPHWDTALTADDVMSADTRLGVTRFVRGSAARRDTMNLGVFGRKLGGWFDASRPAREAADVDEELLDCRFIIDAGGTVPPERAIALRRRVDAVCRAAGVDPNTIT